MIPKPEKHSTEKKYRLITLMNIMKKNHQLNINKDYSIIYEKHHTP